MHGQNHIKCLLLFGGVYCWVGVWVEWYLGRGQAGVERRSGRGGGLVFVGFIYWGFSSASKILLWAMLCCVHHLDGFVL
jgi:hypothetical protein